MNYYILATLYRNDAEYNEEGEVIKEASAISGFHVNTDQPIEGAEEYIVEPTVPRQVFAGSDYGVITYFYSFPDEDTFAEFAPELYPPEPEVEEDEETPTD